MGAERKILIVEDHPTMREAMRLVLEGEGFAIEEAADGESALAVIRAAPPDLLFLDLNIPGPSGTDVLEAVRADPASRGRARDRRDRGRRGGARRRAAAGRRRVLHEAVQSDRVAADGRAGVGRGRDAGSVTAERRARLGARRRHVEPSPHRLGEQLGDVEPEPEALRSATRWSPRWRNRSKISRLFLGRDPGAAVDHLEHDRAVGRGRPTDRHAGPRRGRTSPRCGRGS